MVCTETICARDSQMKCKSKDAKAIHQPNTGFARVVYASQSEFTHITKGSNFHLPFFTTNNSFECHCIFGQYPTVPCLKVYITLMDRYTSFHFQEATDFFILMLLYKSPSAITVCSLVRLHFISLTSAFALFIMHYVYTLYIFYAYALYTYRIAHAFMSLFVQKCIFFCFVSQKLLCGSARFGFGWLWFDSHGKSSSQYVSMCSTHCWRIEANCTCVC